MHLYKGPFTFTAILLLYRQQQTICRWFCQSERATNLSLKKKKDLRTVITLVLCYSVMPEDLLKSKFLLTSMAILSRQGLINNCRTSVLETPDMYMIRNSFLPATTGPHVQVAKRISGTELHFKVFTMHIAFFHASRKQCGFVVGS